MLHVGKRHAKLISSLTQAKVFSPPIYHKNILDINEMLSINSSLVG